MGTVITGNLLDNIILSICLQRHQGWNRWLINVGWPWTTKRSIDTNGTGNLFVLSEWWLAGKLTCDDKSDGIYFIVRTKHVKKARKKKSTNPKNVNGSIYKVLIVSGIPLLLPPSFLLPVGGTFCRFREFTHYPLIRLHLDLKSSGGVSSVLSKPQTNLLEIQAFP